MFQASWTSREARRGGSRQDPARPRRGPSRSLWVIFATCLLGIGLANTRATLAQTTAPSPAETAPPVDGVEAERRDNPGGNHPIASLDAYLRGREAWSQNRPEDAIREWERSAGLDENFLPPRLALSVTLFWEDPSRASATFHQCLELLRRDYRAQRWVAANCLLGVAAVVSLAFLLILAGILARHARAMQHTMVETLAYSLRLRTRPNLLAWAALLLPLLANLGVLVTALFWSYLGSYRFGRGERMLVLAAGAWGVLIGPLLLVAAPFWNRRPDGWDALLIYQAQEAPSSPAYRGRVQDWLATGREGGAPHYLEGLSAKVDGRWTEAMALYHKAGEASDVPPSVLETNVGTALLLANRRTEARKHFARALELEPSAFEPHYNLALINVSEGRYLKADRELERAGTLNLDRLRALDRRSDRLNPERPVDALWSAVDLWSWNLRHPGPVVAPQPLALILPMRSLAWTGPLCLAAVLLGLAAGRWLKRLLRVHVCYHCGGPVCRRCLVRLDRRAYCSPCAESLSGRTAEEATQLLLRRLIEERPSWTPALARGVLSIIPGFGPALFGEAGIAAVSGILGASGLALLLFPLWSEPLLAPVWGQPLIGTLRGLGLLLFVFGVATTAAGMRWNSRRAPTLRSFLARDVDRLAA